MLSTLCSAVLRGQARRLGRAVAAAPLPASLALAAILAAPYASMRGGRALGAQLSGVAGDPTVSGAIVAGPALAAAVAGAAFAAALPGRSAFGQQVAAAPFGAAVGVLAQLLPPAIVAAVVVVPTLLGGCVALGAALPGGPAAGLALTVGLASASSLGAIATEAGIALGRGRPRRAGAVVPVVLGWCAAGVATGAGQLGPLGSIPPALAGESPSWLALALALVVAPSLVCVWVVLAAGRPLPRASRARSSRQLVRRGSTAMAAALAALLSRRRDVRISAVGALLFGAAGIGLAASAAAPGEAAFLLATTTALLGSVVWPLVTCGALLEGRWLWLGCPRPRHVIVSVGVTTASLGAALPVAVVGVAGATVTGPSAHSIGIVAALSLVGSAAALLAGSIVPWRASGAGDQLTTFAAFGAVVVAMSLAVGASAPRLVAAGIPDAAVVVLACVVSAQLAGAALARRLGSVSR